MTQEEFRQRLEGLLETARSRDSRIALGTIREAFGEQEISQEQFTLICDYLLSQKILVEGYEKEEPEEEISLPAEDENYLREYREQLEGLKPAEPGEREALFRELLQGKQEPKNRLSELYLGEIPELARKAYTPEAALADLIQEGNLQLMLALGELEAAKPEDPDRWLRSRIREGILALARQQKDVRSRDRKMVSRVEELKDTISILKEEFGRKLYADEVADYMNISEEEVEAILKLAGEEVPKETD